MKKAPIINLLVTFSLGLLLTTGCTKSGSDSSDTPTVNLGSDCGVVVNGNLQNPVAATSGELTSVEVIAPNVVGITLSTGKLLVKLQGLETVNGPKRELLMNELRKLAQSGPAYFFQSASDPETGGACAVRVEGGGTATVGQLVTQDGRIYTEVLIGTGLAELERREPCSGELVSSCYQALYQSSDPVAGVMSEFLWKPFSERDGNLVILLSPSATQVLVNGTPLTNDGPSNGYSSTYRAGKSGCAFGRSTIRVMGSGGVLAFPNGAREFVIEDGCQRVEM